jgi:hypothetical protein
MKQDFESTLEEISVAYDTNEYTLCIKLCSDALFEQNALTGTAKVALLQFITNCSQKLLGGEPQRGSDDPTCSFCGRQPPSVRLGAGSSAFICNECVELFSEALKRPVDAS